MRKGESESSRRCREIVNSPRHGDGQGYVMPNNAGVGFEEGVGVRQVSVQ